MKLSNYVLESLKSTLAHNTAQKRLQSKEEANTYLKEVKALLTNMQLDQAQISALTMYARKKSLQEVKQIQDMYNRYGIKINVEGNGGSAIKIEVLLEMLMQTAATKED